MERYGENGRGNIYERLAALRQIGSVEDYAQELDLLIAQAKPSSEQQVLGISWWTYILTLGVRFTLMIQKS